MMETVCLELTGQCDQENVCDDKEGVKENRNENELDIKKGDSGKTSNKQKKVSKKSGDRFGEMRFKLNEVSVDDLNKLCEQIATLNGRIRTARDITHLRYDLPTEMKDKLESEAQELESLYAELRDATRNLQAIQLQRAAIGKERQWMENQINKLKNDAIAEMEMIVSVYDNVMMERWEAIKQGNSVSAVENFLHDVKGKLEAMKNLQVLGCSKLAELENEEKKKGEVPAPKNEKKKMNREEGGGGGSGSNRSGSNIANSSQTSLPFLLDTDSEDMLDDGGAVHSVLYSLVYDQVLNLPAWTQDVIDVD